MDSESIHLGSNPSPADFYKSVFSEHMIYESFYYKRELLKLADKILKRKKSKRQWTESQHGTFEKEIMIGFYIIRKLIEAQKLTSIIAKTRIKGIRFPNNKKMVHMRNKHKFDELYDFDKGKSYKFDLIFLCNQIIHSYICSPGFGENDKLGAIVFSSDNERNKWLFEIDINLVVKMFKKIGNDYPSYGSFYFNPKKNDYEWSHYITKPKIW